jgi:hypothetical protein
MTRFLQKFDQLPKLRACPMAPGSGLGPNHPVAQPGWVLKKDSNGAGK